MAGKKYENSNCPREWSDLKLSLHVYFWALNQKRFNFIIWVKLYNVKFSKKLPYV